MSKLGLVMGLIAILCVPGLVMAKGHKGKKNKNAAGSSVTPTPTSLDLQATVTKVEGDTVTVTLQLPMGYSTAITVDGTTKTRSDLKVGQHLTATFKGTELSTVAATTTP